MAYIPDIDLTFAVHLVCTTFNAGSWNHKDKCHGLNLQGDSSFFERHKRVNQNYNTLWQVLM